MKDFLFIFFVICCISKPLFSQKQYPPITRFGSTSSDVKNILNREVCDEEPVILYEEKIYGTVKIGDQCWMRENLNVGEMITSKKRSSNNKIIEKYCYDDNEEYCNTFGGLYRWSEATQYVIEESNQGICPEGWRIPSIDDFTMLEEFVNGEGNTLKEEGQGEYLGIGNNLNGFSALLGGFQSKTRHYARLGLDAYFWSSTPETNTSAIFMGLHYQKSGVHISFYNIGYAFSIRCIKN